MTQISTKELGYDYVFMTEASVIDKNNIKQFLIWKKNKGATPVW